MAIKNEDKIFKTYTTICGLIYLIISPWTNKDSIVVPKVVVLFALAMFLLPTIIKMSRKNFNIRIYKVLILILLLILMQLVMSILASNAPIEQQLFGKMGRGLGFITSFSLLVIILATAFLINYSNLGYLLKLIIIIFSLSSLYSVAQSYGFDFVKWETKTNGIFGTLGNPNFQSSAAAMAIIPCLLLAKRKPLSIVISALLISLNLFVIIRTFSVQGFIGLALGISLMVILVLYYRNMILFVSSTIVAVVGIFIVILAMINQGPLKGFSVGYFTFYKASVESRGDFWRSAVSLIENKPFFGVGLDSFGDYYLKYRDSIAVGHTFSEYTDNAHNYFLEYAATGGLLLSFGYLLIALFTIMAFIKIMKNSSRFNKEIVAIFGFWFVFQAQSMISPGSISLMIFNSLATGAIIGISRTYYTNDVNLARQDDKFKHLIDFKNYMSLILAILIIFPYFNSDRLYLKALNSGDANLLVQSSKQFPESTLKYSTVSRLLLESRLYEQSLAVSKSAIIFNPRHVSPWAHIILNPLATYEEKLQAKNMLIKLDPNNKELLDLKISE